MFFFFFCFFFLGLFVCLFFYSPKRNAKVMMVNRIISRPVIIQQLRERKRDEKSSEDGGREINEKEKPKQNQEAPLPLSSAQLSLLGALHSLALSFRAENRLDRRRHAAERSAATPVLGEGGLAGRSFQDQPPLRGARPARVERRSRGAPATSYSGGRLRRIRGCCCSVRKK